MDYSLIQENSFRVLFVIVMEKRELEREFHMTGYARNSSVQKKSSDNAKHITLETVQQLYKETRPKSLGIADLGCSSGPNTLSTIRDIIKTVEIAHHRELPNQPLPEFSIFLNDLPQNDFNSIFKTLPDFHMELKRGTKNDVCPAIFIAACPGSFYGRLFPEKTIHFIYSSFSLHWLSKVPPGLFDHQGKSINKGCINICSSSPEAVSKAYYSQFKEDFSMFLRSRSKEVVAAGRMVLIILEREGPDHGETEEEKLDSYETQFYAASAAEIEGEVNNEGSFELEKLEIMEVEKKDNEDGMSSSELAAKTIRAVQESMLAPHFGEEILNKLFDTYGRMFDEELAKEDIRPITFMDLQREFHMTGGVGKTSYARNSSFQKKAYDRAKDIIVKTLQQLYKETRPKSLGIADLGCSSGPNTLSTIRDIIKAVIVAHHPFPGSFYGRLFPENTIHFIYASFSLHWLSKIPPGLYDDQGKSSSRKISPCSSGLDQKRMVLIILGREGPEHVGRGNSFLWELLAEAIADLVSQGEIEEEKLDSYELHFYAPSAAEIEGEVNKEGSFELEKLDMLEVDMEWGNEDGISYGKAVAKTIRAVQESMLASHFGEEILDKLFDTYGRIIDEEVAKEDIKHITFFVVLRRKL
ncbi:hypothetical protein HID58_056499 [Brassica napus]|uniref:Uncharacterized protein n=1 Tax=Brassica napus TaxID=3708 RepID=A0ABQ8APZ3_BRANA|nr:hypothetical protein HID58_056499 [Brassica napus]